MDARKLLELVQAALMSTPDTYAFAAQIVEAQKEEDAKVAEAMGHSDVADAIRA